MNSLFVIRYIVMMNSKGLTTGLTPGMDFHFEKLTLFSSSKNKKSNLCNFNNNALRFPAFYLLFDHTTCLVYAFKNLFANENLFWIVLNQKNGSSNSIYFFSSSIWCQCIFFFFCISHFETGCLSKSNSFKAKRRNAIKSKLNWNF